MQILGNFTNPTAITIEKIKSGVYPKGSLLPPERELMDIYKVQRTTVRRGLDILSSKGHIKKAAGLGSIVSSLEPVTDTEGMSEEKAKSVIPHKAKNICVLLESGKTPDTFPSSTLDIISVLSPYQHQVLHLIITSHILYG